MNIKTVDENFSQSPKEAPVLLNRGFFSFSSLAMKALLDCILPQRVKFVL